LISGQPDRRKMAAVLRWLYFQHHFRFSGIWQIKILKQKYPGPGSRPSNALPPPRHAKSIIIRLSLQIPREERSTVGRTASAAGRPDGRPKENALRSDGRHGRPDGQLDKPAGRPGRPTDRQAGRPASRPDGRPSDARGVRGARGARGARDARGPWGVRGARAGDGTSVGGSICISRGKKLINGPSG